MVVIRVLGVEVRYNSVKALDSVSVEIREGEVLAVVGPNGSGKTTLLKTIDGILRPSRGCVYIDMKNVFDLPRREVAKIISFVPTQVGVSHGLKVIDFVLTGRRPHISFSPTRRDFEVALKALEMVDALNLADRDVTELSSGELQRVVIARALAAEPKVLLLDEPTANLDLRYQIDIMNLIRRLCRDRRLAVVASLHDLTHAYRYSDHVLMLNRGRVVAYGKPEEVLNEETIERVYGAKVRVVKELKAVIPIF